MKEEVEAFERIKTTRRDGSLMAAISKKQSQYGQRLTTLLAVNRWVRRGLRRSRLLVLITDLLKAFLHGQEPFRSWPKSIAVVQIARKPQACRRH
jgi:hypothetical protein